VINVFKKANCSVSTGKHLQVAEAEEAQSKIEELKDEEYNERRMMQMSVNEQEIDQML
jgi:hypothetical protein